MFVSTCSSKLFLQKRWQNIFYRILCFHVGDSMKLPVCFPLIKKSAKRHEPNLALRPSQQSHPVEDQSGKQLFVVCPTGAFFEGSSSLST